MVTTCVSINLLPLILDSVVIKIIMIDIVACYIKQPHRHDLGNVPVPVLYMKLILIIIHDKNILLEQLPIERKLRL